MAKAPRANDDKTPKKRSRKTSSEVGNSGHPENGHGTQAAAPIATSPTFVQETHAASIPEEKVRARAYELYLQRGGRDGSPEQDWQQAMEEIRESAS